MDIKYNGIVVIQSLPDEEVQTGKILYDDIIARRCDQNGHGKYFYNPADKAAFFVCLEEICAYVHQDELMPVIHFEIHGSQKGLALKNGEHVLWTEIQEYCRFINTSVQNQLIITLATCYGSGIWQMIDITKPAPYWGYIGPREKIGSGNLMEDFGDFYDSLLTEKSWEKALNILVMNGTRKKYAYLHCEGIFEHFIEKTYRNIHYDKSGTFKRLAGKTKAQWPGMNRADRRKGLKTSIGNFNRTAHIAKLKKIFLMN
ncbi:hypothetical protein SAMN05216464_11042 [Mucilaginibacter pineti]|uniref:Uncharacterized protein n=1 Tax=Mucilaginibacter pineti TaxID=1391627 RepID=A0A1G7G9U9_9SPHI|nr:hypothetical protein [Mucilaginibacter pineti]SDE84924.1 hypothetical protein SAMN05216464_11042 [Mucilaginibacter pineti]